MSYQIRTKEKQAIWRLPEEERYSYLVEQITKWETVWTLSDENGFVVIPSEDANLIPIWPHETFAAESCTEEWQGCQPLAIPLAQWQEKWLPGLAQHQMQIAAFPDLERVCFVVDGEELSTSLEAERAGE